MSSMSTFKSESDMSKKPLVYYDKIVNSILDPVLTGLTNDLVNDEVEFEATSLSRQIFEGIKNSVDELASNAEPNSPH